MNIFITGATGFIGQNFIQSHFQSFDTIFTLVRENSLKKATQMFKKIPNVNYIVGDITHNNICKHQEDFNLIVNEVHSILNLAGQYQLDISVTDAYFHNIIGMQNIIFLAQKMKYLEFFHHISTYAVRTNEGSETFPDNYCKSKKQGEDIFAKASLPNIKKRIYRPGIVIGSSQTGSISKIDGPYFFLQFLQKIESLLPTIQKLGFFPFPFDPQATFPIIPVDTLCYWLKEALTSPSLKGELKVYNFLFKDNIHIESFIKASLNFHNINVPILKMKNRGLYKFVLPQLGLPRQTLHYLFSKTSFDMSQRKIDFPHFKDLDFKDYQDIFYSGFQQHTQRSHS